MSDFATKWTITHLVVELRAKMLARLMNKAQEEMCTRRALTGLFRRALVQLLETLTILNKNFSGMYIHNHEEVYRSNKRYKMDD